MIIFAPIYLAEGLRLARRRREEEARGLMPWDQSSSALEAFCEHIEMRWEGTLCVRCGVIRIYHSGAGCVTFTSALARRRSFLGIIGKTLDVAQRIHESGVLRRVLRLR